MSATCHPITQALAQTMLEGVVRAVCDRTGVTGPGRETLADSVVQSVLAFEPRDAVELMMAGMAVTHFHLVLDAAQDASAVPSRDPKGRGKSGVVALGRVLLSCLRELRLARRRPLAEAAAPSDIPAAVDETLAEPPVAPPRPPAAAESRGETAQVPLQQQPPRHVEASIMAMMAAMAAPPARPATGAPAGPRPMVPPGKHPGAMEAGLVAAVPMPREHAGQPRGVAQPNIATR